MASTETQQAPPETPRPIPLGWADALLLQLSAVVLAMVVQIFLPRLAALLHRPAITVPVPWNWVLPVAFVLSGIVAGYVFRDRPLLRWLSGAPFAVTSIIIYTALGLLGIFLVQDASAQDWISRWGGRTLFTSLPFLAASLCIMLNLSTLLGRRLLARRPGYLAFLCNHLGLLLVMIGMMAGSAQLQRHKLELMVGQPVKAIVLGNHAGGKMHFTEIPLGATLTLKQFTVEFYPPHLFALDFTGGGMGGHQQRPDPEWVSKGHIFTALDTKFAVLDFLPSAQVDADGHWTSAPHQPFAAARVRATLADGTAKTGWVAVGSGMEQMWPLQFAKDRYIAFAPQRAPKRFRSVVTVTEPGKAPRDVHVEVNQPLHAGGWRFYQTSYGPDEMNGGYYSELEAVRDPAMPVVYTGLVGMLLGAFLAFWFTPRRRIIAEEAS